MELESGVLLRRRERFSWRLTTARKMTLNENTQTHSTSANSAAGRVSTSYKREHPLLTLGLAVTAGYVLSRLLASR